MISKLKLNFSEIPFELAGYPIHYKVMNQALERVVDGSILMDSGPRETTISLESEHGISAGKYVFTLLLPSGQMLSTPFQVEDGKESVVNVPYEHSPQEWLRSQTLLGHSLSRTQETLALEKLSVSVNISPNDPALVKPKIDFALYCPQYTDRSILLYKANMNVSAMHSRLHIVFEVSGQDYESATVAELKIGNTSRTVVLPPLSSRHINDQLTLDCAWSDTVESVTDLAVHVNMQNKAAQALLSYMQRGDIESAQKVSQPVIDEAYQMFREKMQDPAAACVAGYLLTSTSNWKHMPLDWCSNLSVFFPHIADGSIINAHRRIVDLPEDLSPSDLQGIADLLLLAAERGLPIYSAGLRLLNDDLLALSNSIKELGANKSLLRKVDLAYQRTTSWLQYCDFKNPFTTLIFESEKESRKIFTHQK